MADILVIGSANIDYTLNVDCLPSPGQTVAASSFDQKVGGKGLNQAAAAARAGGSVAMIACVGDDLHGKMLRDSLNAEGVCIDNICVAAAPSGTAVVMTAAGADNMIAVVAGANAMLRPSMLTIDQFVGIRIVLCQLEIPMETVMRASQLARAVGATFVLDPAPARAIPRKLLACVDWLTPNESEARTLLDLPQGEIDPVAAARNIRALGVGNVVMKLGKRGSLLLRQNDEPVFIPAHDVMAVDTTAAGDSFNGAFGVALGEGAGAEDAAHFASVASTLAVTRPGARDAMPFRSEIERLCALNKSTPLAAR